MSKIKKEEIGEEIVETTPEIVKEHSEAYKTQAAFYEKYKIQNPAKYALKKAAFDAVLATL